MAGMPSEWTASSDPRGWLPRPCLAIRAAPHRPAPPRERACRVREHRRWNGRNDGYLYLGLRAIIVQNDNAVSWRGLMARHSVRVIQLEFPCPVSIIIARSPRSSLRPPL